MGCSLGVSRDDQFEIRDITRDPYSEKIQCIIHGGQGNGASRLQ